MKKIILAVLLAGTVGSLPVLAQEPKGGPMKGERTR